jgi:glycosyltransferase involved in cell wall biosynthesis
VTAVLVVAEQLRRAVPGGIGTYAQGLLGGLAGLQAVDVTVYASRAPRHRPDPLARFGLPLRCSPLPGRLLTRAWDVGVLRAPPAAGVVHAVSLAAPATAGGRLVVTVHDLLWRQAPADYPPRGRRWHEAALRRALARAAAFVVPSPAVADELAQAGASADRVFVVEHGSDHLPDPDVDGAARLLEAHGVRGPYLLSVGTLEPRKNLSRLVAAYRRARPRLPEPWPLVVVGPAGWGAAPDLAGDGVVAVGRVDGAVLAGLYHQARLLAYVPLAEGYGLPPVEAMRAGVPVVASPLPSTTSGAWPVDPADVDAIADGLTAVAGDERVRAELVRAGRARSLPLTWKACARAHRQVWESLA